MASTLVALRSVKCNPCTLCQAIPHHYFTLEHKSQEVNDLRKDSS